jgi:hypothetical protein
MEGANVIENGGGSGKLFLSKVVNDTRFEPYISRTEHHIPVTVLFENGLVLRWEFFYYLLYIEAYYI